MTKIRFCLSVSLLMIAILVLSACDIEINTSVNDDGSGTTITKMKTGIEIMEKLMQLPNAQAFSNSWMAAMKAEGNEAVVVDDQVTIRREFQSAEEFSSSKSMASESWAQMGKVSMPDGEHLYFLATFDTNSVYKMKTAGQNISAREEMEKQLDESKITYNLELPGEVLASNNSSGLSWNLPMRQITFLFAESKVTATEETKPKVRDKILPVWNDVIRITGGIAAGVMLFSLIAYPWRKGPHVS